MRAIVAVGSYERVLYGVEIKEDLSVTTAFALPAHLGCIKSIAACKRFLASGGTDEQIKLFDLRSKKEIGSLTAHEGTVTALAFFSTTHLLTGGEDGRVCLFRSRDWECLHVFRGHKKAVTSIAIHPSGKLAISVGKDHAMKLWNLVTGKMSHSEKLGYLPERVGWSASGNFYYVLSGSVVKVYKVDANEPTFELNAKAKLNSATFYNNQYLLAAGEDHLLYIFDLSDGSMRTVNLDHIVRIREISLTTLDHCTILVSASSDGLLKIWDIESILADSSSNQSLPKEHNASNLRITCMTSISL